MKKNPHITEFEPFVNFKKKANRISFVLYGNQPHYILGAIHNAVVAPKIYKDWICRFYIDKPRSYCNILKELNCEIFFAKNPKILPNEPDPKMWRLYPLNDPDVEYVIFRDADSILSLRERFAVDEWIKSGKTYHRMKERHHIPHRPILTGMWGAYRPNWKFGEINDLISNYHWHYNPNVDNQNMEDRDRPKADEEFMLQKIWPEIKSDCFYHGVSDDGYGKATPFTVKYQTNNDFSTSNDCDFVGSIAYGINDLKI